MNQWPNLSTLEGEWGSKPVQGRASGARVEKRESAVKERVEREREDTRGSAWEGGGDRERERDSARERERERNS